MTSAEAWERISQAFQYLATGGSEDRTARGDLFEELARVAGQMVSIGTSGPASQLDANGTILDVDVINVGELLTRVGTTIISTPAGAPGAHHLTHENGGADEILVTGLSGQLADPQPPIIGAAANQAVAGNDPRLTNARTPTAHHVTHENGGTDQMSVAGLTGLLATAQTPAAHTHPEADVVGLVTDLANRGLLGQLLGLCDPGNVNLPTSSFYLQFRQLIMTGARRMTIAGTGRAIITDLNSISGLILGTPRVFNLPFTVPADYVLDQLNRIALPRDIRATVQGTGQIVLTDDFNSRSRVVMAGRG